MLETAKKNIADVLAQAIHHSTAHQAVVVYDANCELARTLTDAYRHSLPEAQFVDFASHTPDAVLAGARRVLILEGVNDYENLGSLFRNAVAFGVDAVLLDPTTADPLYRRTTRVSLGHVLRVPFARVGTEAWPTILSDLRGDGLAVLALTPAPDATTLAAIIGQLPDRVAVLVGAEGPGLSDEAMASADHLVRIPMTPGTDSVNVATAAAIALAALYRPQD